MELKREQLEDQKMEVEDQQLLKIPKLEYKEEQLKGQNIETKDELQMEGHKTEVKDDQQMENQRIEVKDEQLEANISETKLIKDEEIKKEEIVLEFEKESTEKENEELITDEKNIVQESVSQELQNEENIKKNEYEDLEIPDSMEIIQVTENLSPKVIDELSVENNNPSSPMVTQDTVSDEIKPKSPSPISTMTCSIDGNTDTEWNVPVAPSMGTIKINISQKSTPSVKPIIPTLDTPIEPQSPLDFTPTFGEIDPDQPPPPGLEMETVVAPKVQREMKPRLMLNAKKLKEYPIVNKGKEMSGLCSIM